MRITLEIRKLHSVYAFLFIFQVVKVLEDAILATDLAVYFRYDNNNTE